MSDKDYYPAGAYNDPNAPYNKEDPRDSQDWEDMHINMWDDRILDINGYFLESFSEQSDENLRKLAKLISDNENGTHTITIGAMVTKWVLNYCKPKDDEVDEVMGRDE